MQVELTGQALIYHNYYHYPVIDGKLVRPIPYLTLPFRRESNNIVVSEGWVYSRRENNITGYEQHKATDWKRIDNKKGTKIYAPCDGYVFASYANHLVTRDLPNGTNEVVLKDEKQLGSGLGVFIQLYNPEFDRYLQIGHLDSISDEIPFSKPVSDGNNGWLPSNFNIPPDRLMKNKPIVIVFVRKDQFLGTMGTSGLTLGYKEYHEGDDFPDLSQSHHSWDNPHAHVIGSRKCMSICMKWEPKGPIISLRTPIRLIRT